MPWLDSPAVMGRRLRTLAVLLLGSALLWAALEALIFRSGFYYRVLAEPHSNAGASVMRLAVARREASATVPTVLVMGDSRIGEGFSKPLADAAAPGLNFVNIGLPGSTPRAWYYLLRAVERAGVPFDTVVVGLRYRETAPNWPDWPLDPAFMAPLVDWRDWGSYVPSFNDPTQRRRAAQSIMLPTVLMQPDLHALLRNPWARLKALGGKRGYLQGSSAYPGNPNRMPALQFAADGTVQDWSAVSAEQRAWLAQHQEELARPVLPEVDAFTEHWLRQLLEVVRARGARLVIYPLPRGPYREWLGPPQPSPALAALATAPEVTLLPADFLADLEAPDYFFDALHANQAGRRLTSERLAAAVQAARAQPQLQPQPAGAVP